jgi:predicted GIY-YIG superfamily endonuclease
VSERTAVYWLFAEDDSLLYIGVSKGFGKRWTDHARKQPWWPEVDHQVIRWHDSRADALAAERSAIREQHPRYNIIHNGAVNPWPRTDRTTGFPAEQPEPMTDGEIVRELRRLLGESVNGNAFRLRAAVMLLNVDAKAAAGELGIPDRTRRRLMSA